MLKGSFHGVYFRSLTSLSLIFKECVPVESWVELFGGLPQLLMVTIQLGLRELCAALVYVYGVEDPHNPDVASTTNHRIIPFRALQCITVREERGPYSDENNDCVRRCLRKRLDLNVSLKELCVIFGNEVKDHVDALEELVEFVQVLRVRSST